MAAETYINKARAMSILTGAGDFTPTQAEIVLMHSRKQARNGQTMYPAAYIMERARENAARPE